MIEQKNVPSFKPTLAIAELQFRSSNYPVFEEVPYPMELQNFISSMGGNMGVWFGASFLSVIHMMICGIKYIMMKLDASKKNAVMNDENLADNRQIAKVLYPVCMKTME